ncbi:MAG: PD-(D/E)XK nuclease family protein [Planctomycetota bacterium]
MIPWERPILAEAVDVLLHLQDALVPGTPGAAVGDVAPADLRRVLVVLPGGRAGRVLLRDLLAAGEAIGRPGIVPPRITTPASVGSAVLGPASGIVFAAPDDVLLTAVAAVANAEPELRGRLAGDLFTESAGLDASALALAHRVLDLEHELAFHGRRPEEAAAVLRESGREEEADAWDALAELAARRRAVLRESGLRDPAVPTSEPHAETDGGVFDPDRLPAVILLVGLVELSAAARQAIEIAAAAGTRVLAIARGAAPEDLDPLGCLRAEAWADRDPGVLDADLRVGEGMGEQAALAVAAVAELAPDAPADEVVLGLLDPGLERSLISAASAAGGTVHVAGGRPLRQQSPWRLLETLGRWLESPRARDLADLLRFPRFEALADTWPRWRAQRSGVAASPAVADDSSADADADADTDADADAAAADDPASGRRRTTALFDGFIHDRVPDRLDSLKHGPRDESARDLARLAAARRAVSAADALLESFRGGSKPLSAWSRDLSDLLANLNVDRLTAGGGISPEDEEAWTRLAGAADGFAAAPPALDPEIGGAEAIRLLLDVTGSVCLAERPLADAVDAMGLLELPLESAPNLVLLGVHDGAIPGRGVRDPLLPESLRQQLGLPGDQHRLGRDAYLLTAALRGRRAVRVIAGRRGVGDDPLIPSRLLLPRGDDGPALAARLERLVDPDRVDPAPVLPPPGRRDPDAFGVPMLEGLPAPETMSVTAFKHFLECPYRFALRHLLKLDPVEEDPRELTPAAFGSVLHAALDAFARDAAAAALTEPEPIAESMRSHLDAIVRTWFGARPRAAVRLQVDRMRQRLEAWARTEARWRAEGWRTVATEHPLEGAVLEVPDEAPMPIRGTVDRIDHHAGTGQWRIVDYKTGDAARDPVKAHLGTTRRRPAEEAAWSDLQLPLYRHLLEGVRVRPDLSPVDGDIEVGYVLLPRSVAEVGWRPATWDEAHHASAIERARDIVREVRGGRFEPATRTPRFDPWAWIVQRPAMLPDAGGDTDEETEDDGVDAGDATGGAA